MQDDNQQVPPVNEDPMVPPAADPGSDNGMPSVPPAPVGDDMPVTEMPAAPAPEGDQGGDSGVAPEAPAEEEVPEEPAAV